MPGRDRAVSVARLDGPLDPDAVRDHLLGREAYRRTRFVVLHNTDEATVAAVAGARPEPLMSPITDVDVLAGPADCAWVHSPATDTTVPTQMAAAARAHAPGRRCVVVRGRYAHVNFILDPRPVLVRVVEVVPPEPPKLADQVRRLLDVAEDLPPVAVTEHVVDLRALAGERPADRYLFPCRGAGATVGDAAVDFLDQRPPRRPWTLVGCERSRQLHRWFYGDLPDVVDSCPRTMVPPDGAPTLLKCCLLESGLEHAGATVTVPWGASLAEVRAGLDLLARATEPTWAPA